MIAISKLAKILLLVFACLHLVFSVSFALKTPYRQAGFVFMTRKLPTADVGAPDERQHANYIRFLLKDHTLPVLDPKSLSLGEEYQSHQPPFFYVSAAIVATVTGQTDVESQSFGNTIRIFNCLIGVFGVCGVFFAALWASKREEVAIVASAFAALLPMNCALSGAISNDPLLFAFISWSFAYCSRAFHCEDESLAKKYLLSAAIFTGVACITKTTGLVALAGLGATLLAMKRVLPGKVLATTGLLALAIAIPVWLRNQMIYGDPLAQKVFKEAFVASAQKSTILDQIELSNAAGSPEVQYWINWVGYWTARSFVGVFGNMDIWLNGKSGPYDNDPNYLYKGLIAFIAVAKLSFLLYLRNKWKEVQRPVLIGFLMSVLTGLLFVAFNMTYFQAQGRYLLPAIAPLSVMFAIGWLNLFKSKLIPVLVTVVVLFGGTTIYALTQLEPEFSDRISGSVSPR
jgi:4-amino-4-deoxy-L-arabinose transferase-like glycosyltransferase